MKKNYISPAISIYMMASARPLLQASKQFDGGKRNQDIKILDDDIESEDEIG